MTTFEILFTVYIGLNTFAIAANFYWNYQARQRDLKTQAVLDEQVSLNKEAYWQQQKRMQEETSV